MSVNEWKYVCRWCSFIYVMCNIFKFNWWTLLKLHIQDFSCSLMFNICGYLWILRTFMSTGLPDYAHLFIWLFFCFFSKMKTFLFRLIQKIENNRFWNLDRTYLSIWALYQRGRTSVSLYKRIHTNEMPYNCDIYTKQFTTKGHLVVHFYCVLGN